MKRILTIFCFIAFSQFGFAQNKTADSLLLQLSKAKNDSSRIGIMDKIIYDINDLTQSERINYSEKILELAKKKHDKILESVITAEMGYLVAINGNTLQGSEMGFNALEIAHKLENKKALGIIYMDLSECFRENNLKSKEYLLLAMPNSEESGDYGTLSVILSSLSKIYFSLQQPDSALFYAHRCYEICVLKNLSTLPVALIELANVNYYLLHNKPIAFEYLEKGLDTKSDDYFVNIATNLASLFEAEGKLDSALFYTKLAQEKLIKVRFTASLDVYRLYKKIYSKINSDSALKYYRVYEITKDSIDKMSNIQLQQLLAFKKEMEMENDAFQRRQDLQFTLIAIGIIILLILYLLLSRSFITDTRIIEFMGVIALLIVFEFLNLLLHPFLERITHHSPLLMLLGLVCIAALLVPLHHNAEKWVIAKLVEKNKKIRLADAKKTIEELEKKQGESSDDQQEHTI